MDVSKVPDAVPKREPRAAYGNNNYTALGVRYTPMPDAKGYRERGVASWYGKKFHGRPTSSREPYDMYAMTAAHKTLPLPAYVRVRNLQNDRVVIVRVNDRGPFLHDRVIDLSYAAAYKLGIVGTGTGLVEVEAVEPEESTLVMVAGQPATPPPRHPGLEIISTAAADTRPPPPKLYLQVGAFTRSENAEACAAASSRLPSNPVFVQPPAPRAKGDFLPRRSCFEGRRRATTMDSLLRVAQPPPPKKLSPRCSTACIGPLTGVEEGDRLGEQLRALGHSSTHTSWNEKETRVEGRATRERRKSAYNANRDRRPFNFLARPRLRAGRRSVAGVQRPGVAADGLRQRPGVGRAQRRQDTGAGEPHQAHGRLSRV